MNAARSFVMLVSVALVSWAATADAQEGVYGTIPNEFDVNTFGEATYSMPLFTPVGPGGMKPNLSLEYRHRGGDGALGRGWGIGGLSAITRCPRTVAQDSTAQGVSYAASDRLCLDGQRLVVTSGTYGAGGSEYRAELDAQTKIVASTVLVGGGPREFVVTKADGSRHYYGHFFNSSLTTALGPYRSWRLYYIEDRFNNGIRFIWEKNDTTGEQRLTQIEYTRNDGAGVAPQYRVVFTYENKPTAHQRSGYIGGAPWSENKRLTTAAVQRLTGSWQIIYNYNLAYLPLADSPHHSLLEKVQQCGPTQCLNGSSFEWADGQITSASYGPSTTASALWTASTGVTVGDFNGDGLQDLATRYNTGTNWNQYGIAIYYASGGGSLQTASTILWGFCSGYQPIEFNGDGRTDLLCVDSFAGTSSPATLYVKESTAGGWVNHNVGTATWDSTYGGYRVQTADVNGDGLTDLIHASSGTTWGIRLNTPGSGFGSPQAPNVHAAAVMTLGVWANMDDDVALELLVPYNDNGSYFEGIVLYSNPLGPSLAIPTTGLNITRQAIGYPYSPISLPDINGDGLADFAYRKFGSAVVHTMLNLGNNAFSSPPQTTTISSAQLPTFGRFADANNDGRDDLFLATGSGSTWQAHLSNGTTFIAGSGSNFIDAALDFADVTGDGYLDAIYRNVAFTTWYIHPQVAELETVTSFWDGRGNWRKPTYAPLSTMDDHYNWSSLPPVVYPERLFRGPLYVVDHYEANTGTGIDSYSYATGVVGDSYLIDYWYYDAKVHNSGRGFLGFRWIQNSDSRTVAEDVVHSRGFHQDFPFIGRLDVDTVWRVPEKWIETDFNWATVGSGPPYRVRMESSTTTEWEVGGPYNGQLIRTIVHDPTYETTYGNVDQATTTVTAHSGETYTTTVDYTLVNFTSPWCLGLPDAVSVARSGSGMTPQTRTFDNVFNGTHCRLESRTDTSETDPNKQLKTTLTYDIVGNVKTVRQDSANGAASDRLTELFYDPSFHLPTSTTRYITGEPNHTESRTWDYKHIVPLTHTAVGGLLTTNQYNEFGQLDFVTHPDGTTTDPIIEYFCGYCVPDAITHEHLIGSDGSHSAVHRDSYGRPLSELAIVQAIWGYYEWRYDAKGNIASENLPYRSPPLPQFVRTHQYDFMGRRTQTVEPTDELTPTGSTTTWSYQRLDTVVTRSPQNQTTTETRDALGRTVRITDAMNGQTQYQYNAFDQLTGTTDPANHLTTISYNNRGDKTALNSPDLGQWWYEEYNVFGELTRVRDAKSQTVLYGFDQLGRPDWRSEPDFPGTLPGPEDDTRSDYAYHITSDHRLGLPKYETFPTGYKREYLYDSLRRQSSEKVTIDGTIYTTDFGYYTSGAAKGKLQRITYPTSTSGVRALVDYEYDSNGVMQRVRDGLSSTVYYAVNQVDALYQPTQVTLGNTLVENRSYDSATYLLESIQTGTGGAVQNLEYDWDPAGNLKQRKDNLVARIEDFTYDALNRLDTQKLNGAQILNVDYTVGGDGNIAVKSNVGNYAAYGGTSGGPHAVTSITGLQSNLYAYDANGNMTNRDGDAITWYSHNLPKKINYGTDYAEFWYGTDRSRYKQVALSGGTTVTTRYIGAHYEKEERSGLTIHRHNILAGDRVVAQYERRSNGTNFVQYLHRDHQSNVVATTNSSGVIKQRWEFDPFGTRWRTAGSAPDDTERGYTGHEHLDAVGLIHMNGRVQDPMLGRFISADPFIPDPFDSQSFNRYSYVNNNPLTLVDPSGFQSQPPDGGGAGEVSFLGLWVYTDNPHLGGPRLYAPIEALYPEIPRPLTWSPSAGTPTAPQGDSRLPEIIPGSSGGSGSTGLRDLAAGFAAAHAQASADLQHELYLSALARQGNEAAASELASRRREQMQQTLNFVSMGGVARLLAARAIPPGSFNVINWAKYPSWAPKPTGTLRMLSGAEYDAARKAANAANAALRRADPAAYAGKQIHEIVPVQVRGQSHGRREQVGRDAPAARGTDKLLESAHEGSAVNWARVEQLLASCDKQASAGSRTDLPLGDYGDVFARYDGIEGFVGTEQYVQLWKADDIVKLNAAYHVGDYAPGLMLFGTDGGDTGYGIDGVTKRYISVPLVGLSREAFRDAGGTFEEFLEKLADE